MRKLLLNPTPLFRKLRQLSLLLTLLLVPLGAWGQDSYFAINTTTYGSTYVTDENKGDIFSIGKMSYDIDNNVLTLDGINLYFTSDYFSDAFIAMVDQDHPSLTVRLIGNNTITLGDKASVYRGTSITFITDDNNASNASLNIVTENGWTGGLFLDSQNNPITPTYSDDLSLTQDGSTYSFATPYNITLAGIAVTSANAANVLGDGKVSFTPASDANPAAVLTLNGASITPTEGDVYGLLYTGTGDLTISLNGTNTIKGSGGCNAILYDGAGTTGPKLTFTNGGTEACSLLLETTSPKTIDGFGSIVTDEGLFKIDETIFGADQSNTYQTTITSTILGGGSGSPDDPFIIATAADLKDFSSYVNKGWITTNGKYFKLSPSSGSTIDCTGLTGFQPIGIEGDKPINFTGTFDGNKKTIKNLSVTGVSGEHVGLFRCLDGGTITQLILDGCTISGGDTSSDYIGGIVGYVSSGTVSKCTVQNGSTISCSENSQNPTVGGIVGYLDNGEITECVFQDSYVKAETSASGVSGPAANSGGIVGKTAGGTVSKCQVKGAAEISAIYPDASTKAGAIIGMINSVTMSENTYDYSVKTTVQNTTYSGYTQRGIGGNSSGGSNYDEIGKVELATKKVEIYVLDGMGTGPYSVENTNYYISKDNIYYVSYYVSPNKEFKCSATPSSAYYKPRLTLDDGTIEVTPVEIYNSGVYNHTEFTFTMPNADVTATLSFPINLAADGITATIDDLDYTGSAIEPTTIKVTGIPGPTGVTELTKGTDFTIIGYTLNNEPADPINPGEYKVTIEGMGNYTGSMVIDYKINNVYNLKINGTQVKGANIVDVFNDGKVVFTPATDTEPNTLTLSGAEIGGTIESGLENLTIQINGVNSLEYITSTNNTAPLIFKKGTVNSSLSFSNTIGKPAVAGFASVAYNETYYKSFGSSKYVAGDVREFRSKYGGAQQDLTITTDVYYPLWVRDTQVSSANKNNVLNDENATVKFDGTNTLTLNGASISSSSAIDCNLKDLVIYLNGDNTLGTYSDGIYPILSLDGTGTLTIAKDDNATGFVSLSLQTTGNTAVISGFSSVVHTGLNFISKTGTTLNGTTTYDATLSSATIYPLWVGGEIVTESVHSGSDWSYDAANNKLTLTNYDNTGNYSHAFISNMANLNVYLVGTNTVGPSSQISTDKAFYTTYTDATLTFSTDENNKGTLDASGFNTFCEGFRDVNGIYCNNGLGYYPGTREIKAKATPTIKFEKRDQTSGAGLSEYVGASETLQTAVNSAFKAPNPTFENGYEIFPDSTRYVYSYSVDGVVEFPTTGTNNNNPTRTDYGEISLLKAGTVTITCTFPGNMQNNPCSASYTLQVNKADAQVFEYEVDGQKITAANGYIDVDGTTSKWGTPQVSGAEPTLSKPDDVTSIITYGSSDNNVATISETGAVTPKGPGTAIISATLKDDERYNDSTATYTLIVMAPATVSFANATASILNTETYTQAATTIPEGSSITYSSSNNDVNVNANGEVTISNSFYGKATITATVTAVPDADPQYYYVLPDNTAFQATYDLTVSKVFNSVTFADGQNYATYYNESENMTVPEGLTAYLITGTSDNSVVTYPINYLPQNVPLLLEKSGTAGSTLTNTIYSGTELTDAERRSNNLQYAEGDLITSALGGTPYILYKNEFVKAIGTIPQNHCYLLITNPAPTRGYYSIGNGNDGSTAIDDTLIDNEETTNDDWYDLQGRRIQKPTKAGIYIKNGKKIVVNNK